MIEHKRIPFLNYEDWITTTLSTSSPIKRQDLTRNPYATESHRHDSPKIHRFFMPDLAKIPQISNIMLISDQSNSNPADPITTHEPLCQSGSRHTSVKLKIRMSTTDRIHCPALPYGSIRASRYHRILCNWACSKRERRDGTITHMIYTAALVFVSDLIENSCLHQSKPFTSASFGTWQSILQLKIPTFEQETWEEKIEG